MFTERCGASPLSGTIIPGESEDFTEKAAEYILPLFGIPLAKTTKNGLLVKKNKWEMEIMCIISSL